MEDKYNLTREQNIFVAKRNIVDYIWKSANLEGIKISYPETQAIYDGEIVNGFKVEEIVAINNLKYAWNFILENERFEDIFSMICDIYKIVMDKLVFNPGFLRTTPVNIGGTDWKPQFPIESQIKEELDAILNKKDVSKTEIAIDIMLPVMRRQMFLDGNKRVVMLFANKIMIDNGCGIISIPNKLQTEFYTLLIKYYETDDSSVLKEWLYENAIDGIQL